MGRLTSRTLIILSAVWLTVATASEIDTVTSLLKRQASEPLSCKTDRSSDYYGFGVRLGIYFNWFGAFVASTMKPDEIAGQLDTNAIFMFALLVAMVRCSITGMLQQLDGLMLMHLSGGTIFGVFSIWGYRTCYYLEKYDGLHGIKHFGGLGTHTRLLLATAVSAYGLWFWLYGVTGGLVTGEGECEQIYTFFFAKLRVQGGIRVFYIFICISCLVYFGTMLIVSVVALYARIQRFVFLTKTKQWANTTRLRYATGWTQKELRRFHYVMRYFSFIWLCWSIAMIEVTLNFNHVMSVLGQGGEVALPSQLIPLLIGTISFVRVLYLKYESWRSPDDIDPSIIITPANGHAPKRAHTFKSNRQIFKLFSPAMSRTATGVSDTPSHPTHHHEDDDVDELLEMNPHWRRWRYVIAWLPWLSLLIQSEHERDYINNQDLIDNNMTQYNANYTDDKHPADNPNGNKKSNLPPQATQVKRKPVGTNANLQKGDESNNSSSSDDMSPVPKSTSNRPTSSSTDPTAPQLPAITLSRDDSFEKQMTSVQPRGHTQTQTRKDNEFRVVTARGQEFDVVVQDGQRSQMRRRSRSRSRTTSQQRHGDHQQQQQQQQQQQLLPAEDGETTHHTHLATRAQSIARKFGKSGISYERD